jgi:uncharacterized protein (UPF0335 family)
MTDNTTVQIFDGQGKPMTEPMAFGEFKARTEAVTKKLQGKSKEGPMAKRDNAEMFSGKEMGTETAQTVAAGQLKAFIERVERLEEEKQTIADDIKDIYTEMKGTGFDTKAVRTIVKLRKKDQAERQEEEAILDLYKAALGMV